MICCIVICLILSLTYSHFPTDVSFPLRASILPAITWMVAQHFELHIKIGSTLEVPLYSLNFIVAEIHDLLV